MGLSKQEAKGLIREDFIPGGPRICDVSKLRFRRTREDEVYQCCLKTSDDPQSGPIFCGEIAEYLAQVGNVGIVCLCERHRPPVEQIE